MAKNKNAHKRKVLKVDIHCEGCSFKIIKFISGREGVEKLDKGDGTKLRDKHISETNKKVDVIKNNDKENKKSDNKTNKPEEEKPKKKAILKMRLCCEGCTQRIYKTLSKAKGVNMVAIDKEQETVIVEGTMDVKVLIDKLGKKFKRVVVELVQPEKVKDEKKKKKNREGEGENKKGGDGNGNGNGDDNNAKMEVSTSGHGYEFFGQVQMTQMQVPQMFSDENPNACSVM